MPTGASAAAGSGARRFPQVDLFLAATERARRALLLEGARDDRIEIAPPGIDTARFGESAAPAEHLVLSVGRLVWEKGHQDLLRALAWLRREGHAARALIVGAGPEEAAAAGRMRAIWASRARSSGARSVAYGEMPDVFAKASCFVLASLPTAWWEEQFGMVLAEAAAAGLPIVAATRARSPRCCAERERSSPPGDWSALARALGEVLAAPPERRRPAALVAAYSIEAAAERYAAAYERVLSSR